MYSNFFFKLFQTRKPFPNQLWNMIIIMTFFHLWIFAKFVWCFFFYLCTSSYLKMHLIARDRMARNGNETFIGWCKKKLFWYLFINDVHLNTFYKNKIFGKLLSNLGPESERQPFQMFLCLVFTDLRRYFHSCMSKCHPFHLHN